MLISKFELPYDNTVSKIINKSHSERRFYKVYYDKSLMIKKKERGKESKREDREEIERRRRGAGGLETAHIFILWHHRNLRHISVIESLDL